MNFRRPIFTVATIALAFVGVSFAEEKIPEHPQVVNMNPSPGSASVDPNLKYIEVTFDRDMGAGMSWTGGGEIFPPLRNDEKGGQYISITLPDGKVLDERSR